MLCFNEQNPTEQKQAEEKQEKDVSQLTAAPAPTAKKRRLKAGKILSLLSVLLILALIVKLVVDLAPLFHMVAANTANESVTIEYISSYGKEGMPIIIGLQALQVIVAFFPAAPIQAIAGVCYGMFKGLILCMLGYLLGNLLVFWTVHQFRSTLEPLFAKKEAKAKSKISLDYIKNLEHPERVVFALYLIPCIPNGIIPYLFAFSRVRLGPYLLAVLLASIPSILLCTWVGQLIAQKEYLAAGAVTVLIIVLLVLALINQKKLTAFLTKDKFPNLSTKRDKQENSGDFSPKDKENKNDACQS